MCGDLLARIGTTIQAGLSRKKAIEVPQIGTSLNAKISARITGRTGSSTPWQPERCIGNTWETVGGWTANAATKLPSSITKIDAHQPFSIQPVQQSKVADQAHARLSAPR